MKSRARAIFSIGHRDGNEPDIFNGVKAVGCLAERLTGKNVTDLLIWSPYLKKIVLMEVKTREKKNHKNKGQDDFRRIWTEAGAIVVKVSSLAEALVAVGCPTLKDSSSQGTDTEKAAQ